MYLFGFQPERHGLERLPLHCRNRVSEISMSRIFADVSMPRGAVSPFANLRMTEHGGQKKVRSKETHHHGSVSPRMPVCPCIEITSKQSS